MRFLSSVFVLYLAVFLTAGNLLLSQAWTHGGHVTPEHRAYHVLLDQLGFPHHHHHHDPTQPSGGDSTPGNRATLTSPPQLLVASVVEAPLQDGTTYHHAFLAQVVEPDAPNWASALRSIALPAGNQPQPLDQPPRVPARASLV